MAATTEKRAAGRPPIGENTRRIPIYGADEDFRRLDELAERWGVTKSAVVRRALQLASERGRGDEDAVTRFLLNETVLNEDSCRRLARGVLRVLGLSSRKE